jgi:hypothetical protein
MFRLRLAVVALLIAVTACSNAAPPETPPAYTDAAPEITDAPDASYVTTRRVEAPAAAVRQWIDEGRMLPSLQSTDRVSKPAGYDMLSGTWPEPGAIRRVQQEDGHYVAERVLENTPEVFAYQIWAPTTSAGRNILYGRGEFRVTTIDAASSTLTWTYELKARNALVAPFLRGFVKNDFAPFMEAGMDAFAASAETP